MDVSACKRSFSDFGKLPPDRIGCRQTSSICTNSNSAASEEYDPLFGLSGFYRGSHTHKRHQLFYHRSLITASSCRIIAHSMELMDFENGTIPQYIFDV